MSDNKTDMNITNEVLANRIDNLTTQVGKLELAVNQTNTTFISHDIFELRMKEFDLRFKEFDIKLVTLGKKTWVQNMLSAVLGAILTGLVLILVGYITKTI